MDSIIALLLVQLVVTGAQPPAYQLQLIECHDRTRGVDVL